MQPWKRTALTEEQLQVVYREWGIFNTQKQKIDVAAEYYDISLRLKSDDPKALYNRSRCKRTIALTAQALNDGRAAMASNPLSQPYNVEVCDGLYELNRFEDAKSELFNNSLKFSGIKLRAFDHRMDVLDENFEACLGRTLSSFILNNERYCFKAFEEFQRLKNIDPRPQWKIKKEQEVCDVLSILEEQEVLQPPIEMARGNRAFSVFNQIYLNKSWVDVLFLKELKNDPNLLLPQCKWSTPLLRQVTENKYDATIKFLKMLHARTPLYTIKVRKCPNKALAKKKQEEYLFRVQYQVHRNMLIILKKMRMLRRTKQVEALSAFIEEIMGDYVVLKTKRIMPWKFEFFHDAYNILALARLDQYLETEMDPKAVTPVQQLFVYLRMKIEKDKEIKHFIFGDKSTYQDESAGDLPMMIHKKLMARMEKRILFSKYPIEKAYLLHEISRSHLRNSRFDECCIVARRAIEEARNCKSYVWMLLGLLMTCKSHAVMRKIEKINETLQEADKIATQLQNKNVTKYVSTLRAVNEQDAKEKKLQDEMRRTKSKASVYSTNKPSSGSV